MEMGPYVPVCEEEGAKFKTKQCDTQKYTQAAFQNQWSDSPNFSCFCVDQEGNELALTKSGPSEAENLDCRDGEFFSQYIQWRKQHFDEWLPSFDLYLKKKQIPVDLSERALIDGTCDIPRELRESCQQRDLIGGGEITSVSRCASAECCFETSERTQRVECFKKRAKVSDESLVLNWDADRIYISYLYNHWVKTVQQFTAEANSTGPPLFPGVQHMYF
ncbi:Oidioi.mRNA.OKI2018_I69.chr2.g4205.t1.cds [Oikopleura dioica]|uniref:Oidioi.mRNA.OKI2018_I69.chr2.g4205.t1.cds n=1 Tax=Oikopleura dioica TaxID=34765 RepID=A0ABN7T0T4_OIKDI|nr:Oidioi.mRNA.OKI2018_I69.chr2.g4205.t1.cds [Oikopleura dioica]